MRKSIQNLFDFKKIFLIFFLQLALLSLAQKNKSTECLTFYVDTSGVSELWGCKDKNGKIVIAPKYSMVLNEKFCKMALVVVNGQWQAIDKNENILFTPFISENLPDAPDFGYIRYIENSKIGFADKYGNKLINAQFDYADIFEFNFARVNKGCNYVNKNEMNFIVGGKWGVINKQGRLVIPIKYKQVIINKNRTFEVWSESNEHLLLNRSGKIIRKYFE